MAVVLGRRGLGGANGVRCRKRIDQPGLEFRMEFLVPALGLARISGKLVAGRRLNFAAIASLQRSSPNRYQCDRQNSVPTQPKRSSGQSAAPRQRGLAKPASTVYQKQSHPDMPRSQ